MEPTDATDTFAASPAMPKASGLPVLDYASPSTDGIYRAGTLTYTSRGLASLFGWLLWGDFVWQMKDRSIQEIVKKLLGDYHVSDMLAGVLLVAVPQVIGIVMGPYIAYASDHHRGRWGRRIPFLLLPTPLTALSIIALGFAPAMGRWLATHDGGGPARLDHWVLFFLGLFWIIFDISTTVSNSVFGAFVNDVVPPPVLGRFYGLFRAVSLIAGIVFFFWGFGQVGKYYLPIFVGIGVLCGIGFPMMCVKVKEGQYPPPTLDDAVPRSPIAFFRKFGRECFSKPYYYWVFAAIILPNLGSLSINTFNLYFSQSVGMSNDHYGKLIAMFYGMSLLLTVPLGWLADRYHPLRVAIVALCLRGAAELWGGLFIHNAATFGIAFVLTGMLSGTWLTATASLQPAMLPRMKFAQYACALGITNSVLNMVFAPLMGRFLDLTHHAYRYTYTTAFVLDAAGLLVTVVLWRKFMAMGGKRDYVAP